MVYTPYIDTRKCVIYGYDAYEEMTCNDFLLQNFIGKPLPLTWKLPKYTAEYTNFSLNDFLHGHIQAPFVSAHAQKKLAPILKGQAEFRSIGKIRGEDYYVMNVINVIDCLDENQSEILRGDDGRVMSLRQAVFLPHGIPDSVVFKVPQDTTRIFTTNRLVDLVREHKFTGIGFEFANHMGLSLVNHAFTDLPLRPAKSKRSVN